MLTRSFRLVITHIYNYAIKKRKYEQRKKHCHHAKCVGIRLLCLDCIYQNMTPPLCKKAVLGIHPKQNDPAIQTSFHSN